MHLKGFRGLLARTPQPPPPEPSSPKPLAPVVQPVTGEPVGSTTAEPKLININTASADDLNRLGLRFGKAIIAARPYRSVGELVSKRVLKRFTFSRIKDRITANTTSQPTAAPTASVLQSLTNAHLARASVLPSSADTPPEPSSLSSSSPVVRPAAVESVGSTTSEPKLIDINTASADDLNRTRCAFWKGHHRGPPLPVYRRTRLKAGTETVDLQPDQRPDHGRDQRCRRSPPF